MTPRQAQATRTILAAFKPHRHLLDRLVASKAAPSQHSRKKG